MEHQLGRSVLIYGIAFAVVGAAPFLLLPLLTRHLSPAQFGEVTAFLMLAGMLANVAGLSAPGYVSVRYFKVVAKEFKSLVTSSIVAVCVAHVVAAVVLAALFSLYEQALQLSIGQTMLAVAAALFLSVNLTFLSIFQASGQPILYLRSRLIQALAEVLLCVALILLFVPDAGSRVYSYTVAMAASAAAGLYFCHRRGQIGPGIERAHFRGLLAVGVPMLPHIVAGSALVYLDRMVVSTILGAESLGIYMVAMQLAMVMIALIEPVNRALAPWLFAQLSKNDPNLLRNIVKKTYLLYAMLVALGIAVTGISHAVFNTFINERYAAARPLISWMVAGYVLQGMYYTVVLYLFYAERSGRLSLVSGSTVALGCLISYSLTSTLGLQGAAISFALNHGLLFVLVWFAASKVIPMPWLLWRQ